MKLTEAMGMKMGKHSVAHEGGPCPFCHGERNVVVYLSVMVRQRMVGAHNRPKKVKGAADSYNVARPSFWQGACVECASAVQDEIAERAQRFDYLEKVRHGEVEE